MRTVVTVLGGIGILIGIYLFVSNYKGSVAVIDSIASNTTSGIRTLQGR